MPEIDVTELPNATVVGYAVNSVRLTGTEGEEHAIVLVTFQFQLDGTGMVAAQSFLLHQDDAADIRRMLKNPTPIQPLEDIQP